MHAWVHLVFVSLFFFLIKLVGKDYILYFNGGSLLFPFFISFLWKFNVSCARRSKRGENNKVIFSVWNFFFLHISVIRSFRSVVHFGRSVIRFDCIEYNTGRGERNLKVFKRGIGYILIYAVHIYYIILLLSDLWRGNVLYISF
ncbi:hypothetical protein AA313_de0204469 [Arthrobotrys entomopaga]|nr:hypothetical protein AA313_de0204469 [Arthrobotrys entomopaga]